MHIKDKRRINSINLQFRFAQYEAKGIVRPQNIKNSIEQDGFYILRSVVIKRLAELKFTNNRIIKEIDIRTINEQISSSSSTIRRERIYLKRNDIIKLFSKINDLPIDSFKK